MLDLNPLFPVLKNRFIPQTQIPQASKVLTSQLEASIVEAVSLKAQPDIFHSSLAPCLNSVKFGMRRRQVIAVERPVGGRKKTIIFTASHRYKANDDKTQAARERQRLADAEMKREQRMAQRRADLEREQQRAQAAKDQQRLERERQRAQAAKDRKDKEEQIAEINHLVKTHDAELTRLTKEIDDCDMWIHNRTALWVRTLESGTTRWSEQKEKLEKTQEEVRQKKQKLEEDRRKIKDSL